ncbi:MAG: Flp family type IVb pilin [Hyphomonadaceae bacterium]
MKTLQNQAVKFLKDDRGATAIEYGLILGLMALAIIGAITTTGTSTAGAFDDVSDGFG